jgi:putative ABC transport system permease protein
MLSFGAPSIRSLVRSLGFAVTALLTLALGIGSATALFAIVNTTLIHPLPYKDADRLVVSGNIVLAADFRDIKAQNRVFDEMALYESGRAVLSEGGQAQLLQSEAVSPEFLPMLGAVPLYGRSFAAAEYEPGDGNVVLLSYAFWRRTFHSDSHIIGTSIVLDSKLYTIIGVLPRWFRFKEDWLRGETDIWTPLALTPSQLEQRGAPKWTANGPVPNSYYTVMMARIKRGVTIQEATRNFDSILERLAAEYPEDKPLLKNRQLDPLKFIQVGPVAGILWPLFSGAALLLLIACVNVSGLTLARGFARKREMAIRSVLGARRRQIAGHLLMESLFLSVAGAVLALPVSIGLLDIFKSLAPPAYAPWFLHAGIDGWVLLFAVVVVLLCTIVCGLLTAIVCSRSEPNSDLKGPIESGLNLRTGGRFNAQKWLLIAQICAAMVLLVAASLMGRSLWLSLHQNLGFDPRNVAIVSFSSVNPLNLDVALRKEFEWELLEHVKTLPMIQSAALSNSDFTGVGELPFSTSASPSAPTDDLPIAYWWSVTPEFFSVMHIPLLRGRYFSRVDTLKSEPVVVINQTLASIFFSGSDPLGRHITYFTYDPPPKEVYAEIVGVVPDTKMSGFNLPAGPEIYTCMWQQNYAIGGLLVRSQVPRAALVSALREKVLQTNKRFALVDVKPLEQAVEETFFARRRFLTTLLAAFASLSLILTIVGIFAAAALSVTRRTREIGIRVALGAQRKDVLKTILFGSAVTSLAGVGAGVIAALALTRLIRSWLYGIAPDDPLTFVVAGTLLLLVCLVASYIPSRRALRVDPAVVLRHE